MSVFNPLIELRLQHIERVVGADTAQARGVHRLAKIRGRAVVVTSRLHNGITIRAHLGECPVKILGQQAAHRVKLQAKGLLQRLRGQRVCADTSRGG